MYLSATVFAGLFVCLFSLCLSLFPSLCLSVSVYLSCHSLSLSQATQQSILAATRCCSYLLFAPVSSVYWERPLPLWDKHATRNLSNRLDEPSGQPMMVDACSPQMLEISTIALSLFTTIRYLTFEAFLRGSILDKTAFCLGENQGMLSKWWI